MDPEVQLLGRQPILKLIGILETIWHSELLFLRHKQIVARIKIDSKLGSYFCILDIVSLLSIYFCLFMCQAGACAFILNMIHGNTQLLLYSSNNTIKLLTTHLHIARTQDQEWENFNGAINIWYTVVTCVSINFHFSAFLDLSMAWQTSYIFCFHKPIPACVSGLVLPFSNYVLHFSLHHSLYSS